MGMSSFILDFEEKFWDHAHEVINECETWKEFVNTMFQFDDITTTSVVLNKELDMFWDDFGSTKNKYWNVT